MDHWSRLTAALTRAASARSQPEPAGRVGAVLVLLYDEAEDDLGLVFTRRRHDLAHHPGQISFPGGRVDPGESVEAAALREAAEEIALDPESVEVLGRLPASFIPPSRFWLQPVVVRWRRPHALHPAENEVAEVLHTRLSRLCDPATWRRAELSTGLASWAWQLDERNLLWGATAVVTELLLEILAPGWNRRQSPLDLPPDREVRPWAVRSRAVPQPGPAKLSGVPELALQAAPPAHSARATPPSVPAAERAGEAVADAVARLLDQRGRGSVLVLAGAGGTGAAALAATDRIAKLGGDPLVVLTRPPEELAEPAGALLPGRAELTVFDGSLPTEATLVVDGLVGAGLHGPLSGVGLEAAHALRVLDAPIISLDLPSGLDPESGVVGELLSADVTVAFDVLRPGLLQPGLGPFVGDLYLAEVGEGNGRAPTLRRITAGQREPAPWRE